MLLRFVVIGLLVLMHATFVPQLKTTKQYLKSSTNQSSICIKFPTKTGQVYKELEVVELGKREFEIGLSFFTLLHNFNLFHYFPSMALNHFYCLTIECRKLNPELL